MFRLFNGKITPFVKNIYYAFFGVKLGDKDKAWDFHKVCRNTPV